LSQFGGRHQNIATTFGTEKL